jgi:hypothetical protein
MAHAEQPANSAILRVIKTTYVAVATAFRFATSRGDSAASSPERYVRVTAFAAVANAGSTAARFAPDRPDNRCQFVTS